MLCIMILFISNVYSYCPILVKSEIRKKYQNCSLAESDNGISAGIAQNVKTTCEYRNIFGYWNFHNEISWTPPNATKTPVIGYRVYILYGFTQRLCFQIPKNETKLLFKKDNGFIKGCKFRYFVTPLPIVRIGTTRRSTTFKRASACPTKSELSPLPNTVIHPGSDYSFKCEFKEKPLQIASVSWLFSKNKTRCEPREILYENEHINFSKDKYVLKISNATDGNVGCYVLNVKDIFGDERESRGYLDLDKTQVLPSPPTNVGSEGTIWRSLGPMFGFLAGLLFLIIIIFKLIVQKCYASSKGNLLLAPVGKETDKKSVYISHSANDENEKLVLAKFASIIKSYDIEVIIDMCSEVQINNVGGFPQWIATSINSADKVLVLLTPSYLSAIEKTTSVRDDVKEVCRKATSEFNYINNMLYESTHSQRVLLVSKGVKPTDFPYIFKNRFFIDFPNKLDINEDASFRSIIGLLLDEEPFQIEGGQPQILIAK